MRKLFIILVGLIAVVTFITAFDQLGSVNMGIAPQLSEEISYKSEADVIP